VGHTFDVEQVVIDNKQDKNETNNQKRNENDLFPGYEHQIKNQFHENLPVLCITDTSTSVGKLNNSRAFGSEWQVPKAMIGRRLSQEEAKRLLAEFE
jgi:hypothetical protein